MVEGDDHHKEEDHRRGHPPFRDPATRARVRDGDCQDGDDEALLTARHSADSDIADEHDGHS